MQATRWLRLGFFAAAGLQIAALFLDHRLVPYCGTFSMAALLAMAVAGPVPPGARRWTCHLAVAGLALLTLTAFLVERRTDGYGWPAEFAAGFGDHWAAMTEPALLTTGAAALAAAVLGRTGSLLPWWHVPVAMLAVPLSLLFVEVAVRPLGLSPWDWPPGLASRLPILLLVAIVVAALGLIAGATIVPGRMRRRAGAGIFAIMVLAVAGVNFLGDNGVFEPGVDDLVREMYHPGEERLGSIRVPLPVPRPGPALEGPEWALSQRFAAGSGVLIAPVPEEEPEDIEAVSGPPSWTLNAWEGGSDWARAGPALRATFILAGLVALVTALFPPRPRRSGR